MLPKKVDDVDNICRICLAENVELYYIFDENHRIEGLTVSQVLSELTCYKVQRHDFLPDQICDVCRESARLAYLFKSQAEKSFRTLLDAVDDAVDFRRTQKLQERCIETGDQAVQTEKISMYACELCDDKFFEKFKLQEHRVTHHNLNKKECIICHKLFKYYRQLQVHMSHRHPGHSDKECPICKQRFTRREHMHRHLHKVHKENPKESITLEEPEIELVHDELSSKSTIKVNTDKEEHVDNDDIVVTTHIENAVNPIESSDDEGDQRNSHTTTKKNQILGGLSSNLDKSIDAELVFEAMQMDDDEDALLRKDDNIDQSISDNNENETRIIANKVPLRAEYSRNPTTTDRQKITIVREYLDTEKSERKQRLANTETGVNRCEECQRTFSRRCHLLRHIRTHLDQKPHACSQCSKRFARTDHLKMHIVNVHTAKNFKCEQCDWSCARSDALERHKVLRHGDGDPNVHKNHQCDFCDKLFVSKAYLRKHTQMHTDRTYQCKYCDNKFSERKAFREHEKTHCEGRNYLCSVCGESFVRNDYLTVHMRRHNGEKPYKCRYCEKGFPRATDLNIHERYHTGLKPNLCTLCGKGFHRAYNLTIHMRTHSGERPFKCDQCPKSFTQSNDLKAHIRRHTGERYKCNHCDAAFLQLYGLRQHALAVHNVYIESSTGRLQKFAPPPIQPVVQPHLIQPGPGHSACNQQYQSQQKQEQPDPATNFMAIETVTNQTPSSTFTTNNEQ